MPLGFWKIAGCNDIAFFHCNWDCYKKQRLHWHCTEPLLLALQTGGGCSDIALSHCLWVCSWPHKLQPWKASSLKRVQNQKPKNHAMALSSSLYFCPFLFLLAFLFLLSPASYPLTNLLLFFPIMFSDLSPPFLLYHSLWPMSSFSSLSYPLTYLLLFFSTIASDQCPPFLLYLSLWPLSSFFLYHILWPISSFSSLP